jgi:hypothetical protein
MIHPTFRHQDRSFWCRVEGNMKLSKFEVIEANEVVEAVKVIEAA